MYSYSQCTQMKLAIFDVRCAKPRERSGRPKRIESSGTIIKHKSAALGKHAKDTYFVCSGELTEATSSWPHTSEYNIVQRYGWERERERERARTHDMCERKFRCFREIGLCAVLGRSNGTTTKNECGSVGVLKGRCARACAPDKDAQIDKERKRRRRHTARVLRLFCLSESGWLARTCVCVSHPVQWCVCV